MASSATRIGKPKSPNRKTGQATRSVRPSTRLTTTTARPVRALATDPGRVPRSPRAAPMQAIAEGHADHRQPEAARPLAVTWQDVDREDAEDPGDAAGRGHEPEGALVHGKLLVGDGGDARDLRMQAGVERAADEVDVVGHGGWPVLEQGEQLVAVSLAPGLGVQPKEAAHRAGLQLGVGPRAGPDGDAAMAPSSASRVVAPRAVSRYARGALGAGTTSMSARRSSLARAPKSVPGPMSSPQRLPIS